VKNKIAALLLAKKRPLQLLLTLTGAFLGLLIFMGGVQVYLNINRLIEKKDMLGGDYLVVSKKIQLVNTITGKSPSFSENEIQELQQMQGMESVGKFSVGTFRTKIEMDPNMAAFAGPALKSDFFLESVPDGFVDIEKEAWKWNSASDEVPVIIPSDYMKLYNNAFAQSQNLPLIPESLIKSVTFQLRIYGKGKEWATNGRIAGFSERISTILVPQSFMDFANANYGNAQDRKPSRLILHSADPTSPRLARDMRSKGYELNEEKLRSSEINNILQIVMSIVTGVGILIVFLAILGFIQYNQLMAYRSAYEIQTLHWLGFRVIQISMPYIRFILQSVSITFILAGIAVWILQLVLEKVFLSRGFEISNPSPAWALLAGFVISLLMAGIGCFSAHRQVKQLSK